MRQAKTAEGICQIHSSGLVNNLGMSNHLQRSLWHSPQPFLNSGLETLPEYVTIEIFTTHKNAYEISRVTFCQQIFIPVQNRLI